MTVSPIAERTVRVLLVEDNPADADLIRDALEDDALGVSPGGPYMHLQQVDRLAPALDLIRSGSVDVVLLDLSLPDSHGLDTFTRLERAAPGTPVVVLSGLDDEALAARAVREGAQDYLVKGKTDGTVLSRSIRYAVERHYAEQERARLAHARAEAEASLRVRDETLASISHDLRTPLTSIRGLAQLLQRRLTRTGDLPRDELIDRLARIEEQTRLMARMIDDLLDVARIEAGRPLQLRREACDLADVVRRTVADVQRSTDLHTLHVTTDDAVEGSVDGHRIERVVLNLLTNAVKYSPDGGDVEIDLRPDDTAAGNAWAVLTVRDHGIGIPPSDLPHIFERFYRASNIGGQVRGTGIGLAGAQQIVEQHGGTISAESEQDVGTTITVRLPLG